MPPVSDASVQTLTSLAKDFEELAHTCLLVLHLEVRSWSMKVENNILFFKSYKKQISVNVIYSSDYIKILFVPQVRLHCFFYLLPVARGGGFATGLDSQEPDGEVLKLIKDLATIDEALTNTLHPRKCKVFFFSFFSIYIDVSVGNVCKCFV